ncbi:MAG: hypothetical protein KGZ30_03355 [Anaplasmataceae bacterium]|nr:hypothetical protein [Anaplasmataceae bacterium]
MGSLKSEISLKRIIFSKGTELCRSLLLGAVLWLTTSSLPLEDFIKNRDQFAWKSIKTEETAFCKIHWLEVTSQEWGGDLVKEKIWKHVLKVTVPKRLQSAHVLFVVQGGKTGEEGTVSPKQLLEMTMKTGTILAELKAVPNQPIHFIEEDKARLEDGIVAYTWRKGMETKDPFWPLHFPMARAIVRGIDTLEEFLKKESPLEGVVLLGESKRAWAAWLASAVDPRVKGLVSIACDFLNVKQCFEHHYNSLGAFSVVLRDYQAEGIDKQCIHSQEFDGLMQWEDPFVYRDRYQMPKYMINASGDPFSMPDSAQFYFQDLPGPKYLRYIPNIGHQLVSTNYLDTAANFYQTIIEKKSIPSFSWRHTKEGSLEIYTQSKPLEVKLWKAENSESRDFRWDFTHKQWVSTRLEETTNGVYKVDLAIPNRGWAAYFAELQFEEGLLFTTEIFIVPDALQPLLSK